MQVFGMLVCYSQAICLLVNDGSQDKLLREVVGVLECVCLIDPHEGTFQF